MAKQEKITITSSIAKTLHKKLQRLAAIENRSMAATIRCAITEYCKKVDGTQE